MPSLPIPPQPPSASPVVVPATGALPVATLPVPAPAAAPVVPPYVPGTAAMPPLPANYRPPTPGPRNVAIVPTDDVERSVGGEFYCETYLDRDLIPAIYRREGTTTAYVKQGLDDDPAHPGDSFWYLRGGIDNDCWVPESSAGQGAASTQPLIIRGGDASEEHFPPAARYVLY